MKDEPVQEVPFYLSKTLVVNAIIAVCAFVPAARDYVAANPETTLIAISVVGVVLRLITHGRVVLN